jgi:uncharacterized protein (TIGR02001 family)
MTCMKSVKNGIVGFIVIGMVLLFLCPSVFAKIGFRSDLSLVSKYIWRGFDTIADDRPAIQPSVTFDFGKSGVWFNLWSAVALADTDFVELDLVVGYDRTLPKDMILSAGLGYFTFPSMSGYPDENSTTPEIYVGVTANSLPFCPSVTLYYDFNMGDGIYATLSLSKDFKMETNVLNASFLIGYTDQYRDMEVDPGFSDVCLGVSTDFNLRSITLTPSINYVIVPNETVNDENELWVGLMVGWSTDGSAD